ncbi:MAG TPA: outer membrane beta-barrel protein [Spirochaetota bacterium]|nr:outer membrane beta-barrel protein [Spirochaetota bacterium]
MKKLLVFLAVLGLLFAVASDSFARGIIVKGGYAIMQDDYEDAEYDDQPFFGVFFDMGTFLFDSLRFKPGLDYISMKSDLGGDFDVWGIHLDWYWYFLGKAAIQPYLGFGPALNIYDDDDNRSDEDSDAGLEGFVGIQFDLSGPLALMLEARYVVHDIADRGTNMAKLGVAVQYSF